MKTKHNKGLPPGLPKPEEYPPTQGYIRPQPPSKDNPYICARKTREANFRRVYVRKLDNGKFVVVETNGNRPLYRTFREYSSVKAASKVADNQVKLAPMLVRGKDQV